MTPHQVNVINMKVFFFFESSPYLSSENRGYLLERPTAVCLSGHCRRLFGAKPLSEPLLCYRQSDFSEILFKIQFFIHKNASKNIVCGMAAILSSGDDLWLGDACVGQYTGPLLVLIMVDQNNSITILWQQAIAPIPANMMCVVGYYST